MPNGLTRNAGLRLGPLLLETLIKHYFEKLLSLNEEREDDVPLRKDELLYDEVFHVVKVKCNSIIILLYAHS
jgi:hypothetical protein